MTEITSIIDFIQNIGFVGILIILAVPTLRKKVFNGNGDYAKMIGEIKDTHLHEITELLKNIRDEHKICSERIENKLEKINEDIIYIKLKK